MHEPVEPHAGRVSRSVCATCGSAATLRSVGWVHYMSGGDGVVEAGVYCPSCVEGEFGEQVIRHRTEVIECIGCARPWNVSSERWRVYLTDDDPRETVFYCPHCAVDEFG